MKKLVLSFGNKLNRAVLVFQCQPVVILCPVLVKLVPPNSLKVWASLQSLSL